MPTPSANVQIREQMKAWKILPESIQADLHIQGMPKLITPSMGIWTRTVGIIFINPYFIAPSEGEACGDWMIDPVCNDILTNSQWFINGIIHKITPGNYTTTLRVFLTTPGIDINAGTNTGN